MLIRPFSPIRTQKGNSYQLLKASGTLGLGGDYGFDWTPHGTYAQELTFFVNYVGFRALDTLTCATLGGAQMMGREHELGTLEAGKLADVLVVNGDVLQNISILEHLHPRKPRHPHRRDAGRHPQDPTTRVKLAHLRRARKFLSSDNSTQTTNQP